MKEDADEDIAKYDGEFSVYLWNCLIASIHSFVTYLFCPFAITRILLCYKNIAVQLKLYLSYQQHVCDHKQRFHYILMFGGGVVKW